MMERIYLNFGDKNLVRSIFRPIGYKKNTSLILVEEFIDKQLKQDSTIIYRSLEGPKNEKGIVDWYLIERLENGYMSYKCPDKNKYQFVYYVEYDLDSAMI